MNMLTLVVFAIFFLGFYSGTKRGVVGSLRGCVSFLASLLFVRPLSMFLNTLIGPTVQKFLTGSLVDGMLGKSGNALTSLLGNMAIEAGNAYISSLTQTVCLMVSFLLIVFACEIVLGTLWKVEHVPVISAVGRVAGGMIGLLRSGIFIWLIHIILVFLALLGMSQAFHVLSYLSKEPILSVMLALNPLKILLQL